MSAGTSDSRSSTYSFLNILLQDVGRQSAIVDGRLDGPDKASRVMVGDQYPDLGPAFRHQARPGELKRSRQ